MLSELRETTHSTLFLDISPFYYNTLANANAETWDVTFTDPRCDNMRSVFNLITKHLRRASEMDVAWVSPESDDRMFLEKLPFLPDQLPHFLQSVLTWIEHMDKVEVLRPEVYMALLGDMVRAATPSAMQLTLDEIRGLLG